MKNARLGRWGCVAALLAASVANASTADTRELLQAPSFDDFVALSLEDGESAVFQYSLDRQGEKSTQKRLGDELVVAATNDKINITLKYLNPLKFSWTTTNKTEPDPTYQAVSQFAASVNGLAGLLGATKATSLAVDTSKKLFASGLAGSPAPSDDTGARKYDFYSLELAEWAMWLDSKSTACLKSPQLLELIAKSDEDFHPGEPGSERAAMTWRKKSLSALRGLSGAATVEELRKASSATNGIIGELKELNATAETRLKVVAESPPELIKPADECSMLARYTRLVFGHYVTKMKAVLAARASLLGELDTLRKSVDALLATADAEYFRVAQVNTKESDLSRVTVSVKRRTITFPDDLENGGKISITEKDAATANLKVRRYKGVVFEFAPGLAWVYTGLPRRTFGTTVVGGVTIVTASDAPSSAVVPVGMLNLIPRPLGGGPVWIILQAGIGAELPWPMVMTGAGIRFSAIDLSITAGIAGTLYRRPETLKAGDEIPDAAALERDMGWAPKSAFYLGIQESF